MEKASNFVKTFPVFSIGVLFLVMILASGAIEVVSHFADGFVQQADQYLTK